MDMAPASRRLTEVILRAPPRSLGLTGHRYSIADVACSAPPPFPLHTYQLAESRDETAYEARSIAFGGLPDEPAISAGRRGYWAWERIVQTPRFSHTWEAVWNKQGSRQSRWCSLCSAGQVSGSKSETLRLAFSIARCYVRIVLAVSTWILPCSKPSLWFEEPVNTRSYHHRALPEL
jgi:hypothetical protein